MHLYVGQTMASDPRATTLHDPRLFRTCRDADRAADEQIVALTAMLEDDDA